MVDRADGPRACPTGEERDDLDRLLRDLGASDDQIAAAEAGGGLLGLGADLVFTAGRSLSAADLAAKSGATVEEVLTIWRLLGVEVPDADTTMFSDADAEFTRAMYSVDLFQHSEGDELLRVVGSALSRIADAAVAFYIQGVESNLIESGVRADAFARKNATAATKALELGAGLPTVFAHQMHDAVNRQRLAQAEVSDRALFRVAVGFVDLVGFTPLSHRMATRELSTFVSRFEQRAFRVASENGGRIVKHIGDEVMFVALDAAAGCRVALGLMTEFADDGIQPRGGLAYGDVVTRLGDYYGEVVNMASRLADLAVPGEVLVDARMVAAVGDDAGLIFEPAGRRLLKGFEEPVSVSALSRRP